MMHSHDTGTLNLPTFDANGRPCEGGKKKAPLFLQKTFDMINSCDSSLACWADDGLSFIVKDPDQVASDVIPMYFKHNKFSSFVRQLNFYGFRKIKVDPIRLGLNGTEIENKHWRFKHPKFQRGRADLLGEVRRPSENATPDHEEVENMRGEISRLHEQVEFLTSELQSLSSTMKQFVRKRGIEQQQSAPNLSLGNNDNDSLKRQRNAELTFHNYMPNGSPNPRGNMPPGMVQSHNNNNCGNNGQQNYPAMYSQHSARNVSADSNTNRQNFFHPGQHQMQPPQQQYRHQQPQQQNQQQHHRATSSCGPLDSDLLFDVFVDEPLDGNSDANKNGASSHSNPRFTDGSMSIDAGNNSFNRGSSNRQVSINPVPMPHAQNNAEDAFVAIQGFSGVEGFFRKNSSNTSPKLS